jgi:hypothetical protein
VDVVVTLGLLASQHSRRLSTLHMLYIEWRRKVRSARPTLQGTVASCKVLMKKMRSESPRRLLKKRARDMATKSPKHWTKDASIIALGSLPARRVFVIEAAKAIPTFSPSIWAVRHY